MPGAVAGKRLLFFFSQTETGSPSDTRNSLVGLWEICSGGFCNAGDRNVGGDFCNRVHLGFAGFWRVVKGGR